MNFRFLSVACAGIFFTSPVMAAPFDVAVNGYFKAYVNYTEQDDDGTGVREFDILRRSEIHFNAKSTLDNGLTVGVHIEGITEPGADFEVDESLVYFTGDWGNVNFGAKDGAAFLLQVAAPSADKDVDGVREQIIPINKTALGIPVGETDYDQNISAKADKLTYITPTIQGFQAGLSYTPEVEDSRGGNGNALDGDDLLPNSDVVDGALRYEGEIGEIKLVTGVGYTHAAREAGPGDDRQAFNAGAVLGYNGFSIGAAYMVDDEGDDENNVTYKVVGVDYKLKTYDQITLGASYYNKDDEVGTEVETDRYTAGLNYKYAPGLAFRSSVSYLTAEESGGDEADGTSFLLGTILDF